MRINELISSGEKLSVDDVRKIQSDVYSIPDVHFVESIRRILHDSQKKNDPDVQAIMGATEKWDGILKPESTQAPLIVAMREALTKRVLDGKLGSDADKYSWYNLASGN